jgi:hypothetical protein
MAARSRADCSGRWVVFQRFGGPAQRIEAVELGGREQALDGGGAVAGAFRASEQSVLLADRDGVDGVLDRVVVDGLRVGVGIAQHGRPASERVLDGLADAAAGGHGQAGSLQPGVQFGQHRLGPLPAQLAAGRRREFAPQLFDRVQQADAPQRLGRDRTVASGVQLEELAPHMGQAGLLGEAVGEQGLVPM